MSSKEGTYQVGSPFVVLHEFVCEIIEDHNSKKHRYAEIKQCATFIRFVMTLFGANEIKANDQHEHERHSNVKGEEV